jgi:hypothetical protein
MSRGTALVTGASGGIGRALSERFAADGWDLVLVARSEGKLGEACTTLESTYGIEAAYVVSDLAEPDAAESLYETVSADHEVEALVNNVGIGSQGEFVDIDLETELDELQLNVIVPTVLTKRFGHDMRARGSGKVLNVASTAAFQPGPYMAVYYASKAYLLSLSEALYEELSPFGVTVTALCPGPVRTGFQERAGNRDTPIGGGKGSRFTPFQDADEVARVGYEGLMAGKAVVIPGTEYRLLAKLASVAPRSVSRKLSARLNH